MLEIYSSNLVLVASNLVMVACNLVMSSRFVACCPLMNGELALMSETTY